jgi:hypothetical protein
VVKSIVERLRSMHCWKVNRGSLIVNDEKTIFSAVILGTTIHETRIKEKNPKSANPNRAAS